MRLLAFNEAANDERCALQDCDICVETDIEMKCMVMLAPCMHELCERCFAQHTQQLRRQGRPRSCPFCNEPITAAQRLDMDDMGGTPVPKFFRFGGMFGNA